MNRIILLSLTGAVFASALTFTTYVQEQRTTSLEQIRDDLRQVKRSLARDRKYTCCITPSCDFCAIAMEECPCNHNLSEGKPVCHECKGGWDTGYGKIEGVKAENVKGASGDMAKSMFDAKARKSLRRR